MKLLGGMTAMAIALAGLAILSAPAVCWLASMMCRIDGVRFVWHM